jgi:hypothetical protein
MILGVFCGGGTAGPIVAAKESSCLGTSRPGRDLLALAGEAKASYC